MSGAGSSAAIRDWADIHQDVLAARGAKVPSRQTVRRVLGLVDPDLLDRALGRWALERARAKTARGPVAVAVDGKEVRGAKNGGGHKVFLLSAATHEHPAVVGQVPVDAKTNEIPQVKTLLAQMGDVQGMVLTFDALHCQRSTAQLVHQQGAYYLLTVKANQPGLLARVKALPWDQAPTHSSTQTGHGRKVRRTHRLLRADPDQLGFPHAAQVAKVRRTRTTKTGTTWEEVYVLTNHPDATYQQVAAWTRQHWAIENQVHWVRDTLWDEDRSQVRTGTAPRVMATLRNTALSLLRLSDVDEITRTTRYLWANPQVTAALTGL